MPLFQIPKSQSMDKIQHENDQKAFRYSKIRQSLNLDDMYESLNPSVQQLVQQNRKKLVSMNSTKSKNLLNKTNYKLLCYLKARPVRKTYCSPTKSITERSNNKIFNIYRAQDESKLNRSQEIFDFNKLQQIMQTYQRSSIPKSNQSLRFSGALAQKVIKIANNNKRQVSTARPFTNRTLSAANLQPSITNGAYMSWKSQKMKRKTRKLFN